MTVLAGQCSIEGVRAKAGACPADGMRDLSVDEWCMHKQAHALLTACPFSALMRGLLVYFEHQYLNGAAHSKCIQLSVA